MITIKNSNFVMVPTGTGRYNLYKFQDAKPPVNPECKKKFKPHKIKIIISYDMHLNSIIDRINHIACGKLVSKKDIELKEYIKLLASTKVNIEKLIEKEIKN
jgi:hypothetical protein